MEHFLHHFTKVDTLKPILENKTIRFTKLSESDDPIEGQSSDLRNIGRFIFISCWTNADENYSMWDSRYADNLRGIRISLPAFPFKRSKIGPRNNKTKLTDDSKHIQGFLPNNIPDYVIPPYNEENFLTRVQYTDNLSYLKPYVYSTRDEIITQNGIRTTNKNKKIDIGKIGKYKHIHWKHQEEYRYKLFVSPYTFEEHSKSDPEHLQRIFQRCTDPEFSLPFEDLYFDIDPNALKKMIITTGPKISDENYKQVVQLVAEHNPNAKVVRSEVQVR